MLKLLGWTLWSEFKIQSSNLYMWVSNNLIFSLSKKNDLNAETKYNKLNCPVYNPA
jgi:hypothetical protein